MKYHHVFFFSKRPSVDWTFLYSSQEQANCMGFDSLHGEVSIYRIGGNKTQLKGYHFVSNQIPRIRSEGYIRVLSPLQVRHPSSDVIFFRAFLNYAHQYTTVACWRLFSGDITCLFSWNRRRLLHRDACFGGVHFGFEVCLSTYLMFGVESRACIGVSAEMPLDLLNTAVLWAEQVFGRFKCLMFFFSVSLIWIRNYESVNRSSFQLRKINQSMKYYPCWHVIISSAI